MKPRLLILILLIVGVPCGLLTWAAVRIARDEQIVVQQQFHSLMEQRLLDVNDTVARHFQEVEARLLQLTARDDPQVAELRQLSRTHPDIMQMFVLAPNGQLQYPSPAEQLNSDEKSFLLRASRIFTDQHLSTSRVDAAMSNTITNNGGTGLLSDQMQKGQSSEPQWQPADVFVRQAPSDQPDFVVTETGLPESQPATGWFVWYWDGGLNLIYWNRRPSGRIVGTALDRSRWMADLIAQLPDTPASETRIRSTGIEPRIRLVNAASDPVYQWGQGSDDASEPVCEIALSAPLSSWRLQCLIEPGQAPGQSTGAIWGFSGGVAAVALAMATMAFVLIRDYSRDLREAERQVSFVNQVSHELKTPLTNIRLYADLLDKDLDQLPQEESAQPRRRLEVIESEGLRLSRLIGNVLTFARQKRQTLQPTLAECVPDDVIQQVLKHFEPALTALNVRVETQLNASQPRQLDSDFLEQILGNLTGNVEKYAPDSEQLLVRSRIEDRTLLVDVIDHGPGIPVADRGRVFQPFVRLSQDISSAAGTGIGLSISRELARLHGGDVRLLDSPTGCHFQIELQLG